MMQRCWRWLRLSMGWVWCVGCMESFRWDQWGGHVIEDEWDVTYWCRRCAIRRRYQA